MISLPRSTPESMGVNPAAIMKFIGEIESRGIELHSFMMLRHGNVVAEGWWNPYQRELNHMLFSLSKSFTSTAIGFAVAEGQLTVDDPVLSFFKDEAPEKPGKHWDKLKVRHLLSMSTGHAVDTTSFMVRRKDGDWVKGFLGRPIKYKPGTHFLYNTGATYMLSVIVQKLTGQRVLDYLTPRLFVPLGIEGAVWEQCPKGYDTGGFGLNVKTEDIAKFGQFLLQRGVWEGKQLLPAAWVDEATGKHIDNGNSDGTSDWGMGYGYQFWRCIPGCYRGDGAFGQYCIVVPQLDAVFAITSGIGDMQAPMKLIWDILLPAIGEKLPEDLPARKALEAKLASLKYDAPVMKGSSPTEAAVSGKAFAMEKNKERLSKIKFSFSGDRCDADVTWGRRKTKLSCGRECWLESRHPAVTTFGAQPQAETITSASFTWEDDNTLVITSRDIKTPFVTTIRAVFDSEGVEVKTSLNVSFGQTEAPAVKGKMK